LINTMAEARERGKMMDKSAVMDVFEEFEEEYETVFLGNYNINTKDFRSTIAEHIANEVRRYNKRPQNSVLNEA